ncbi:MAG: type I polyketide synthase, partial [Planctomycetaceae bacterium]|nr:type I polyketide synthase [Planctomycetaceae bacterium]
NRTADNPLFVGSVKTNIGHLEAAAGMAGIMKVLLSMQHNRIAGQMNFENPNPHIAWDRTPVKVLTEMTDWPDLQSKIAGVSAFGMSGTNAHVIIEEPPQAADPRPTTKETTRPHLVLVSGKQEESLCCLAGEYANALTNPELALADVSHTTMLGRSHFPHRLAVVARTREDAMEQLRSAARGETAAASNAQGNRQQPKIAWQFTGQGSQYPEMARNLYEHQPLFRAALDECDTWLKSYREGSLLDVLFCGDERIHNTYWTQPAIFAVQMGLVKLLQAWGLEPNMVLGHSVGQYAAACTAGMMSWQDGLRLISERGRLIGELPAGGKMLAVFAPLDRLQPILDSYPDLSLAALNGTHIVVSGTESAIVELQEKMPDGLRSKLLTTSHAFHSQLMEPALQPFQQIVDEVAFSKARLPLVCNVSGQVLAAETELDGHYWARHIREPVQFADSIRCVAENNCDMILEIGPQGILTRMAAAVWEGPAASLVSCLQLKVDDEDSVLSAVGRLYERG